MNIRSFAVAILVLAVAAGAGLAQTPCPRGPEVKLWGGLDSKPKVAQDYNPDKVEIGVGSYKLFELRTAAAGYTLPEREVAVYNRLAEALSIGPVTPDMICIGKVRSAPTIYVGRIRLVSVYPRDAAAAGKSQAELARMWRDRLAEVLPVITKLPGLPGVTGVPAGAYEVAVGGTMLLRLRGKDGFESVTARGIAVERHVVEMLSDGKNLARPVAVGDGWAVMYGAQPVATATSEDAAANGTTPAKLAAAWAARLNSVQAKVNPACR